MESKIKVMLATEGTYPYHHGGVSTWCDSLIKGLGSDIDFILYSVMMHPYVTQKFELPGATKIIRVPLWGTEEPSEHLSIPFSQVYYSKSRTVDGVIRGRFIPLFVDLIGEILSAEKSPDKFGRTLFNLYLYFKEYEYKKSFKSELAWELYKNYVIDFTCKKENAMPHPGMFSIIQSLGWIYRFMTVLNTPVPRADITHSAAAAFCGIPCVLSKFEYATPFILTEHGVYLREQYLAVSKRGYPSFLNSFLIRFIHSIVSLNYYYADQISPVCGYNTRWEEKLGVSKEKIKVIYNGVDSKRFIPSVQHDSKGCPTVVSVARIDPVKDIVTLIKAAALVKRELTEVKFIVYGSITVPEYYEECLRTVEELGLQSSFSFAGHTDDIPSAYSTGDIIVLSSITEGFPYSVVEAMMSGKAVVTTDVGGIKEALGGCGILVPPRDEAALAKGIVSVLKNPALNHAFSLKGREIAVRKFTIEGISSEYLESYTKLYAAYVQQAEAHIAEPAAAMSTVRDKQRLLLEKAAALMELGLYGEAIQQFRLAILQEPQSPAVPYIMTKIADSYNSMGKFDHAFYELEKLKIYLELVNNKKPA